jgi:hypothetical protein
VVTAGIEPANLSGVIRALSQLSYATGLDFDMDWNWWAIAVVPVAWFLQNCIHELSHLLVGWVWNGRKPLGFYPYPHKHDGKWYFARCTWGPSTNDRSPRPALIAPFFAGMIWATLWTVILLTVASESWRIFLVPPAATGLVDAAWWWRGYLWGRPGCDGQLWRSSGR